MPGNERADAAFARYLSVCSKEMDILRQGAYSSGFPYGEKELGYYNCVAPRDVIQNEYGVSGNLARDVIVHTVSYDPYAENGPEAAYESARSFIEYNGLDGWIITNSRRRNKAAVESVKRMEEAALAFFNEISVKIERTGD